MIVKVRNSLGAAREPVIKHKVDEHACDRDVDPHREGPSRNLPVAGEIASQGPPERHYYDGREHYGQDRVRYEDREIEWPRPARARESRRAHVEMIYDVGDQKDD